MRQINLVRSNVLTLSRELTVFGIFFRSSIAESKTGLSGSWHSHCTAAHFKETSYINCELFQAESVRDAAFGCDWVGTPIPFQRCLKFIIATANMEFHLTAGKFVPVSNVTTLNVCI